MSLKSTRSKKSYKSSRALKKGNQLKLVSGKLNQTTGHKDKIGSYKSKTKAKMAKTLRNIYPDILKTSNHLVSSKILN
jgi:hypothetical protein